MVFVIAISLEIIEKVGWREVAAGGSTSKAWALARTGRTVANDLDDEFAKYAHTCQDYDADNNRSDMN